MLKSETVLLLGVENQIVYYQCDHCHKKLTEKEVEYMREDIDSGFMSAYDEELCLDCEHLQYMRSSYEDRKALNVNKSSFKKVTVTKKALSTRGVSMKKRFAERKKRQQLKEMEK